MRLQEREAIQFIDYVTFLALLNRAKNATFMYELKKLKNSRKRCQVFFEFFN